MLKNYVKKLRENYVKMEITTLKWVMMICAGINCSVNWARAQPGLNPVG